MPDSTAAFTRTQRGKQGLNAAPDWHPKEHPEMPTIVARERAPDVFACGYCHLPSGAGWPENASPAGLPASYIKAQMLAFRNGDRPGSAPDRLPQTLMIAVAQHATDAEIDEAAVYFSSLQPVSFLKVVETATVPKTIVAAWTLTRAPDGGEEPISERVMEMADDFARFESRDSRTPFTDSGPVASPAQGKLLLSPPGPGARCRAPRVTAQTCMALKTCPRSSVARRATCCGSSTIFRTAPAKAWRSRR